MNKKNGSVCLSHRNPGYDTMKPRTTSQYLLPLCLCLVLPMTTAFMVPLSTKLFSRSSSASSVAQSLRPRFRCVQTSCVTPLSFAKGDDSHGADIFCVQCFSKMACCFRYGPEHCAASFSIVMQLVSACHCVHKRKTRTRKKVSSLLKHGSATTRRRS